MKLTTSQLQELIESSKLTTIGGYYPGKLLVNAQPAVTLWSQQDEILLIIPENDHYEIIRQFSLSQIRRVAMDSSTMTIAIKKQKSLSIMFGLVERQQLIQERTADIKDKQLQEAATELTSHEMNSLKSFDQSFNDVYINKDAGMTQWQKMLTKQHISTSSASKPSAFDWFIALSILFSFFLFPFIKIGVFVLVAVILYGAYRYYN